ncbi:hypothetical protein Sar04_39200 [Salinispora arenicola]|uniref:Uncharacterized protein n=1 Tax=Salinispora arenicola TaxID=168697 RepID=A0ABQ4JW66_SALAC|nr:hypothetical protein Sar04_39200 [Salinispora arenicola]
MGERRHTGEAVSGGFAGGSQMGAEVGGGVCRRGKTLACFHGHLSPLILVAGPAGTCIESEPDWRPREGRDRGLAIGTRLDPSVAAPVLPP